MTTTKDYDALVEGFRSKIKGNVSSEKMTESECQAEIEKVTERAFNPGSKEIPEISVNSPQGKELMRALADVPRPEYANGPKKRGRPKGSKNKPKAPK